MEMGSRQDGVFEIVPQIVCYMPLNLAWIQFRARFGRILVRWVIILTSDRTEQSRVQVR